MLSGDSLLFNTIMKRTFIYYVSFLTLFGTSCRDVLDQSAVDGFDEDVVFSDISLVKAYVGSCYSLINGRQWAASNFYAPFVNSDMLCSATDHTVHVMRSTQEVHLKGTMSPDNLGTFGHPMYGALWLNWTNQYENIQNLNTILSRIDDVPVTNTTEKALRTQLKGEVYFLRALSYTHLLMMHGGVVLSDKPYRPTDDFSGIKRSSIEATKEFILADIDRAITHLPPIMEQGRATRGAAAAVKSRMLLFCASKLTNGGYAIEANNELVSFPAGSQRSLLEAARDAAKNIMDGNYGNYALVGNVSEPVLPFTQAQVQEYADNYFSIFYQKLGALWNSETIWGVQHSSIFRSFSFRPNLWYGPRGYMGYAYNTPTEELVRKYEMADGNKFVWDAANPGNKFTKRKATAEELAVNPLLNPFNGREARFYASILYHGAPWVQRPAVFMTQDPYNRIQTGDKYRVVFNTGTGRNDTTQITSGVDFYQTPFSSTLYPRQTGYYIKKFLDPEISGDQTIGHLSTHAWIEYRYAEILLNYAEACIELGGADLQPGIEALNLVRHRAGLPSRVTTDQAEARAFVRHEREIELFGENIHFFDLRRWMICDEVIVNIYDMKIMEFLSGDDELIGMSWQLNKWRDDPKAAIDARVWAGDHFYWIPIPRGEMNKAPGLVQNPGYK